ncbi:MAG: DUF1800 domain-containing protein, partial [Pseudomonadales bacterium]|nr:DUF1800 domain-containing protein [Pseudomonadales bacterium]
MRIEEAAIAANRFGYGARPGELRAIAGDPRGWLLEQLVPGHELPAPLAALPSTGDDLAAFPLWLFRYARANRMRAAGSRQDETDAPDSVEASLRTVLGPRLIRAANARLETAIRSETPFRERLIHFWSDHFVVAGTKGVTLAVPPSFERDVARAYVTGRFVDMLSTSTRHPAMQLYLDNYRNIGPNSRFGRHPEEMPRRPGAEPPTGLNENLAREILELHTVGVDGGYDQRDVTEFARVLTGWGIEPPLGRGGFRHLGLGAAIALGRTEWVVEQLREEAATKTWDDLFHFEARAHEPGDFTVLGNRYTADGEAQGQRVLDDLARHPRTATFIAHKLCRHFIADEPPAAAVARVSATCRETEGDLAAVAATLVQSPEAWAPERRKFKRPEEFLISAARAVGVDTPPERAFVGALNDMGQPPYRQPGPDGWADTEAFWASPDALWKRLEWADALARRIASAQLDVTERARTVLGEA